MDEIPEGNLQEEIRTIIEHTVREKRKELLLVRARNRQDLSIDGMPSDQVIREDRDAR